jgi:DNA polymerase I-like protein with 3'-5' exonuclease and polymerase domains
MMNLELIDLYSHLKSQVPSARIVVQLHDAFDVEADERDEEAVCRILSDVMNREWEIEGRRHSFPVEIKVASHSDTWAAV